MLTTISKICQGDSRDITGLFKTEWRSVGKCLLPIALGSGLYGFTIGISEEFLAVEKRSFVEHWIENSSPTSY